jgi:hypothetical protein
VTRVALDACVSTHHKDQNPETQLRQLRNHAAGLGDAVRVAVFVDKAGADDLRGRRGRRELLELAQRRQTSSSCGGRTARSARSSTAPSPLRHLRASGCGLRSLQEPWIDTTRPIGGLGKVGDGTGTPRLPDHLRMLGLKRLGFRDVIPGRTDHGTKTFLAYPAAGDAPDSAGPT